MDPPVRNEMRRTLRALHDRLKLTTVLVTHDREEAFELADRIAVLGAGRIQQIGTPDELDGAPANAFVFEFLGESLCIPGEARAGLFHPAMPGLRPFPTTLSDQPAVALIRPSEIGLSPDGSGPRVVTVRRQIGVQSVTLDVGGTVLHVTLPQGQSLVKSGDYCSMDLSRARLLPAAR